MYFGYLQCSVNYTDFVLSLNILKCMILHLWCIIFVCPLLSSVKVIIPRDSTFSWKLLLICDFCLWEYNFCVKMYLDLKRCNFLVYLIIVFVSLVMTAYSYPMIYGKGKINFVFYYKKYSGSHKHCNLWHINYQIIFWEI